MAIITAQVAHDVTGQANQTVHNEVEAVQAAPPEAPKQTEAPSPRLAELARHQKMIRQQQRAVQAERQAIVAEKQAMEAMKAENEKYKSWQSRLTQDPYSVLLEQGMTADQAAAVLLNQPNSADQRVQLLEQELQALKNSHKQSETKFDDLQKQQYEQAVTQIRNDVKMLVDSDQNFETVKAMDATEAVVELIKVNFDQTGQVMSNEEAAKEVEEYLLDQAVRIASLSKVKAKLTPAQVAAVNQKQMQPQKQTQTLSNRMTQLTTKTTMSDKERKQRAILAFQGKLT